MDENIAKLKELFPEAFTEGKIDFDMLQKLLGKNIEPEKERYSFTWNGKSEAIKIALKQSTGTLRPDKESSKNWDTTKNLYIEGDNLEVLRLLQAPYRGKVKMIYIDPPYNTGNDFLYTDKFNDTVEDYKGRVGESQKTNADTSGRYHTNWLNMMYPRLKLARNLLKDDGVIFISIDDNEQENLKKLCDEIFGEENFVAQFIWNNEGNIDNQSKFKKNHEYILCFCKTFSLLEKSSVIDPNIEENSKLFNDEIENSITKNGPANPPCKVLLPRGFPAAFETGIVKAQQARYPYLHDDIIVSKNILEKPATVESGWSSRNLLELFIRNGFEPIMDAEGKETRFAITSTGAIYGYKKRSELQSHVLTVIRNVGTTKQNSNMLAEWGINFSYPKPVFLIHYLAKIATNDEKDALVLDFFSGSATTAHAVMALNSEDGSSRKFIMVQLPEKTGDDSEAYRAGYKTISEIGMERIRRAGDKIVSELKEKQKNQESLLDDEKKIVDPDKLDIGFKVFKLDTTNLSIWDEKTENLEQTLLDNVDAIKDDRTEEDVLYEVLIKYGIDLAVPIKEEKVGDKKIYLIAGGYLTICLEDGLDLAFIEELAKRKPQRVVFRDTGFKDDTVKTNAEMTLKKHGVEDIKVL